MSYDPRAPSHRRPSAYWSRRAARNDTPTTAGDLPTVVLLPLLALAVSIIFAISIAYLSCCALVQLMMWIERPFRSNVS